MKCVVTSVSVCVVSFCARDWNTVHVESRGVCLGDPWPRTGYACVSAYKCQQGAGFGIHVYMCVTQREKSLEVSLPM